MMKTTFALLLPALAFAQIQGPQLGYTAYNGELRRIEGLSLSSRLSEVVPAGVSCDQLDIAPGMRFAICASVADGAVKLMDLRDFSSRRLLDAASFERVIWSPNGQSVVVDAAILVRDEETRRDVPAGVVLAISDRGAVAVLDESGAIRVNGEAVSLEPSSAAAFDGDALLLAFEGRVSRVDPGRASESFAVPFAATAILAASDGIIYASGAGQLARISARGGDTVVFELPATSARLLQPLADGTSLLLGHPGPGEPGWLFRWRGEQGGAFSFIPGIPDKAEQQ